MVVPLRSQELVEVELRLKEARGQDYATTRLRVPTGESMDPIPMKYFVPVGTYTVTLTNVTIAGTHL